MFGYGWRKLGPGDDYPRYAKIITRFQEELSEFQDFLSREDMGDISPVQCEVTYVNFILPGKIWSSHSELGNIIPSAAPRVSEDLLPPPEQFRYVTQYIITGGEASPRGRLHVSVEPRYLAGENTPMYLMKLTARGAPRETCLTGIIKAMDIGHEWIVRGFTSLTSHEMHREWERTA